MGKAIGMAEFQNVSSGVQPADIIIKTANVDVIEAQVVCPGKYIIIITGQLSAVRASIDAAKVKFAQTMVDSFVLGNPDESIFPAIYGSNPVENPNALGVLETYSAASIIVAADLAAKTADVNLIELRIARGMCGKSYMYITGEVAAVTASIENAKAKIGDNGMLLDASVIPNPDKKLWDTIL